MLKSDLEIKLKPEDFKSQLYLALVEMSGLRMLPRIPILYGQPFVLFKEIETGTYAGIELYDRKDGGDPLDGAYFSSGSKRAKHLDWIGVTIGWPK